MKSFELTGTARTIAARSSEQARALKKLRKEGNVPCVLYGGKENMNFTLKENDLRKVVITPHIYVIDLVIDGKKKNAVLKEVQFHPVKDTIIHVDFYEIDESKPIVMDVPVDLVGLAPGVQAGGKLHHQMRRIKVRAKYTVIPEKLTIDVSNLTLGKVIKIGELSFDGLELVNPKDAVVCSVKMTRAAVDTTTTEETAEGEAAPAEGEAAPAEGAAADDAKK
jgi:large subunit ribosomal protein L25